MATTPHSACSSKFRWGRPGWSGRVTQSVRHLESSAQRGRTANVRARNLALAVLVRLFNNGLRACEIFKRWRKSDKSLAINAGI